MKASSPLSIMSSWIVFGLAGCGGGGGGATTTTTTTTFTTVTTTTTTTVASSVNIQTTFAASTYGAGSVKESAYNYLNQQRISCGFGGLDQNTKLDQAAQAHSDYQVLNNGGITHFETQGNAGFTGTSPGTRVLAAGYSATDLTTVDEVISQTTSNLRGATNDGQAAVMSLFTAPYHGYGMLTSLRDVGVGYNNQSQTSGNVTIDMVSTLSKPKQLPAANQVLTYPCSGMKGVLSQSYLGEIPTPIPNRNIGWSVQPIGTPIYVKVRDGQTLVVTNADLRVVGSNTPETLLPLNKTNDVNSEFQDNSVTVYMPNAPLAKNTTYQFTATGTNNGQPFNINFTFTTGAF